MPHAEATPESRSADMSPTVRSYHEKLYRELMELVRTLGCERLTDVEERYHTTTSEGLLTIAKDPDLSQRFVQLHHLTTRIEGIRRNPTDTSLIPEDFKREIEFTTKETELRSLFHEGFLGFPEIERAFTLKDGTSALEFTEEEKDEARQMLLDKLAEPDIAAFIEHLREHPDEAKNWLLVYRPRAQMRSSLEAGAPMAGISILSLRDTLDADARSGANPTKLVYRNDDADQGWYRDDIAQGETTPWAAKPLTQGWQFVTKDVVEGTTNKKHPDQTPVLAAEATRLGFNEGWRRRTPQEVLFDVIVAHKATGTRLLENRYDWTEQQTASGDVVSVGYFDAYGALVCGSHPGDAEYWDGVCLSR